MTERSRWKPLPTGDVKSKAIIAFLTDFGYIDPYVGICKGVISRINPDVNIIDITHGVYPQNILQAAIYLDASLKDFPEGTIFLAVVDPGVGGKRKAIVIEVDKYFFVGPDNGIFSKALSSFSSYKAYEILWDKLKDTISSFGIIRNRPSSSFHARDIFAPAAALLSLDKRVDEFSQEIDVIKGLDIPKPFFKEDGLWGEILYFDHFGSAITNITIKDIATNFGPECELKIYLKEKDIDIPFKKTYSDVSRGFPVALIGSFGHLEISINCGNARNSLKLHSGDKIHIKRLS